MDFAKIIAERTNLQQKYVENTIDLLEEGATIPFISRYRKERTGGMDEVQVASVSDQLEKLHELEKRKASILQTIESQGKLTDELKQRIEQSWDSTEIEDIYLPYKQKRRTRAQVAREKGLEPMALWLLRQNPDPVLHKAQEYVDKEKGIETPEEAVKGAMDIIAEQVSENERSRQTIRTQFARNAIITSKLVKGKEEEGQKYRDYFDWSEPLRRCPGYRLLAMRRGEAEGVLRVGISIEPEEALERLNKQYVRGNSEASHRVQEAVEDGYKRLLAPSIETEFAAISKEKADEEAIRIFVRNLEQLLMSSPLGQKRVMAIDPGFRTGCKVVCLDSQGNLLHFEAIYPHPPRKERVQAMKKVQAMIEQYKIEAISIGNGTAGRETEEFICHIDLPAHIEAYSVSEDGASIYSASKLAREEFPDYDVTVRGAVSIGRRLMDPLAELVKIDPSSIGVGQYQKDVNQTLLKKSLDHTVESCVNRVGVNLNTASKHLLTYISGLGPTLAQNIVDYRKEHGAFRTRRELLNVPRLGQKAYEQAAGFLRVQGGDEPLDNSAVHPERYELVSKMAQDAGCSVSDLLSSSEMRKKINIQHYVTNEVGLPTLQDIMTELEKPSRDPRTPLKQFAFDPNVHDISDLHADMILPGIVTNITNFGCFVDVGVHTNGLVHIREIANRFVKDPTEVVALHAHVKVKVLDVDYERKRISLSMKGLNPE
ncbi:MAG: RNA-binding transcriptional accessory protein [Bacteroidales bacterium]|nr:RNA-binding transcriptional accessory protein [Bacteroidales bacterium]